MNMNLCYFTALPSKCGSNLKSLLNLNLRQSQFNCCANINTSNNVRKELAKNLKGRSKSSQEWLSRQLADPYVERAKMENYRCRSAFKLLEIDTRFRLLSPGQLCVDCGAAPGSWTQVLVQRTNAAGKVPGAAVGRVVAIDRLPVYPVAGAIVLGNADFTTEATQARVREALDGRLVDVVVSDMAPNATGLLSMDHENIVKLAYAALRFALHVSRQGATVLLKIWDGADAKALENDLVRFYDKVKIVKPSASRTDSAEKFLLARGFKGLKSTNT